MNEVSRLSVVHVRPLDAGPLGEGARGAYANIVARAADDDQYRAAVQAEMTEQRLFVVEFDAIRAVTPAVLDDCDEEVRELASLISEQQPVQYRTFDTYYTDDA